MASIRLTVSSSSTADWAGIVAALPRAGVEGYGLYVGDSQFFWSEDKAKCEEVLEGVTTLNRWTRKGGSLKVIPGITQKATSNPYELLWRCSWGVGNMWWDARPIPYRVGTRIEEYISTNRSEVKEADIKAPSALLAIERARLAMMSPLVSILYKENSK